MARFMYKISEEWSGPAFVKSFEENAVSASGIYGARQHLDLLQVHCGEKWVSGPLQASVPVSVSPNPALTSLNTSLNPSVQCPRRN